MHLVKCIKRFTQDDFRCDSSGAWYKTRTVYMDVARDSNTTDAFVVEKVTIARPYMTLIVMSALNSIVIPVNGLTLFVLYSIPAGQDKRPSLRFIFNLTVADMLSGLPYYLQFLDIRNHICDTHPFRYLVLADLIMQLASLMSIVGMAFDHYIAICLPLRYPKLMTEVNVNIGIVIIWISTLILSYAALIYPAIQALFTQSPYCYALIDDEGFETGLIITVAGYSLGMFIIICLYVRVFIEVFRFHKVNVRLSSDGNCADEVKSKMASLKTAFLILGGFIVFWLPMLITGAMRSDDKVSQLPYDIARVWLQLNTLYDPLIYCVRIPHIRDKYKTMFSRIRNILVRHRDIGL